jgi:hypothetical protein
LKELRISKKLERLILKQMEVVRANAEAVLSAPVKKEISPK